MPKVASLEGVEDGRADGVSPRQSEVLAAPSLNVLRADQVVAAEEFVDIGSVLECINRRELVLVGELLIELDTEARLVLGRGIVYYYRTVHRHRICQASRPDAISSVGKVRRSQWVRQGRIRAQFAEDRTNCTRERERARARSAADLDANAIGVRFRPSF